MRMLAVLAVLAVLLAAASQASAAAATGCPPRPHYQVLAESPRALIAATQYRDADEDLVTVYRACLKSDARSHVIVKTSAGMSGVEIRDFQFSGRFLTLTGQGWDKYGSPFAPGLLVADLRSGRARSFLGYWWESEPAATTVEDITLSTRGYLAWIKRNDRWGDTLVVAAGPGRARAIDNAPKDSMTIAGWTGDRLQWTSGGVAKDRPVAWAGASHQGGTLATTLPGSTEIVADGDYYTAILPAGSSPRVVADHHPIDGGLPLALPDKCAFGGIGGYRILAQCPGRIELYDMKTRTWQVPAGNDAIQRHLGHDFTRDHYSLNFNGVGSSLVRLHYASRHARGDELINPETGAVVRPRPGVTRFVTLDSPTGTEPLCDPVKTQRRRDVNVRGHPYLETQRAVQIATFLSDKWVLRWWDGRDTILQPCGSSRTITLARRTNSTPALTERYVAWVTERDVHVRWLRSGRTQTMRLPKPPAGPVRYDVQATSHRLFVQRLDSPRPRWHVYELG